MTTKGITPSSTSVSPSAPGDLLIQRDHLANVTSLEDERWKRAHPAFCRQVGIGQLQPAAPTSPPSLTCPSSPRSRRIASPNVWARSSGCGPCGVDAADDARE